MNEEQKDIVEQMPENAEPLEAAQKETAPAKKSGTAKIAAISCVATAVLLAGGFSAGLAYAQLSGALKPKPAFSSGSKAAASPALAAPNSIAEIVKTQGAAVVSIETETVSKTKKSQLSDLFGLPRESENGRKSQGLGSGFIVSKDGYILTNQHVVNDATTVSVKVSGYDSPFPARIVGQDPDLDLAVLKIAAPKELPALILGDDDQINPGDWAIAIGNPLGLDHTVTVGVVSAKGRPLTIEGNSFKNLLQTDASINPGNSGGPLLNMKGEVVGINTAVSASAQGIGFAIPVNTAKGALDQLISNGKIERPWLGVAVQDLTADVADYYGAKAGEGVLISLVAEGGPAEKAGLARGDVILEANKKKISKGEDLPSVVSSLKPGDKIELLILRNGAVKTVSAQLELKK